MKTPKIIRYRLGVSRTFPTTHKRKAEYTGFVDSIYFGNKIHTIRSNYELWSKRMEKVKQGLAVIELFYWEGKPYNSKQIVFATLDKDSGCGVQWLNFNYKTDGNSIAFPFVNTGEFGCHNNLINVVDLAKNDGLTFQDFKEWFRKYDLSSPLVIIHFGKFRY